MRVTYPYLGKQGRLGNQLFQIAATIAYAKEHGAEAFFPHWEYNQYIGHKIYECEPIRGFADYHEPHFHYSEIPKFDGDVNLHGFFQSEKYFKKHESIIRETFMLNDHWHDFVTKRFMTQTMDYQYKNSWCQRRICAIHVRRGDYVTNVHTNAYHGSLGVEYYRKAVEWMYGEPLPTDVLFYVFSDAPQWCKENLNFPHMIFSEGEEDIVDLFKMARCDDFIIANSSFSWWGAWLSGKKDKRVVAPRDWFLGAKLFCIDLLPSEWNTI